MLQTEFQAYITEDEEFQRVPKHGQEDKRGEPGVLPSLHFAFKLTPRLHDKLGPSLFSGPPFI